MCYFHPLKFINFIMSPYICSIMKFPNKSWPIRSPHWFQVWLCARAAAQTIPVQTTRTQTITAATDWPHSDRSSLRTGGQIFHPQASAWPYQSCDKLPVALTRCCYDAQHVNNRQKAAWLNERSILWLQSQQRSIEVEICFVFIQINSQCAVSSIQYSMCELFICAARKNWNAKAPEWNRTRDGNEAFDQAIKKEPSTL